MRTFRWTLGLALLTVQLGAQTLSGIQVDQLSDDQLRKMVAQAQSRGIDVNNADAFAQANGIPTSEVTKIKERLAQLNSVNQRDTDSLKTSNFGFQEAKRAVKAEKVPYRDTTGVFGLSFFRNAKLELYEVGSQGQAKPSYMVGAGDELTVSIYGTQLVQRTMKVDEKGFIEFSGLWRLNVAGMKYSEVEDLVRKKLQVNFQSAASNIYLTLSYARSITVHVGGEVLNPGSYTLPATNSAFNFIMHAGGPGNDGTLRQVKLIRDGKEVANLDLYTYLTNPSKATVLYAEDGDYLVIGPASRRVALAGAVRRPMLYEPLPTDKVSNVLAYAGGFAEKANNARIRIKRAQNGRYQLLDVASSDFTEINVAGGDSIFADSLVAEVEDYVAIYGGVRYPGRYAKSSASSLSALVQLAGGYVERADQSAAYILREQPNGSRKKLEWSTSQTFQSRDHVYILTQADQGKTLTVGISGAVHLPQTVAYAEGLSLGELLQMAGGVKLDADLSRVEVSRVVINPNLPQRAELFSFNLPDAAASDLEAATEAFSFVLKPFDQVVVRAKPNYSMQKLVYVGGEVKYPGYYALSTYDERLSSLVSRAGGSTKFGDLSNAQLYRNEAPNVVVDLKTAVSAPSSKANFVLSKGDSVVVPEVNNLVMIYGAGHQSFSITGTDTLNAPYVGRLRADRYIKDFALGFAKRADRSTVYVKYPNGKFSRTKTYPFMRVYPVVKQGATISVVNKPLKEKRKTQINLDLNQVIATMVSAATGFATVYVLLTR